MNLRSDYPRGLPVAVLLAIVLVVSVPSFAPAQPVSIEGLQETVDRLTDPALAGRRSGTPGAFEASRYIHDQFAALGLETEFQNLDRERRNVVARAGRGSGHIVIGAHYDGQGGANPGASDNAAGVAVMLELARRLGTREPDVSLVFIAFDDEEQGLNGARYYAANPVYPLEDLRAAVILDTMGRSFLDLEEGSLIVLGTERSPQLEAVVNEEAAGAIAIGTDLIGARSDFAPFAARGVPYLFFTNATHADYHGAGDTAAKIRYDRLAADAATIRNVVEAIADLPERPEYADEPRYPADEAVSLGVILDLVESQRPDLGRSYRVLFDDARDRLTSDPSRSNLRLATEVLLAAATPRFAFFSLAYLLGPLYQSEDKPAVARAAYREAARMAPDDATRASVEEKLDLLGP